MKKSIFLSVLALAAVVSCQKSEIVDSKYGNEEIGFESYVGRDAQTKATPYGLTALPASIGVYGFYLGTATDWSASSKANLWVNEEFAKPASGLWSTENKKYWTNGTDTYTFFAYAPYADGTLTKGDGSLVAPKTANLVDPELTYTVPTALANQVDLIYSNNLKPTWKDKTNATALTFNHALSRFNVYAAENAASDFTFTIKKIYVKGNFYTKGTFNLGDGDWDTSAAENYTVTENKEYVLYEGDYTVTTSSKNFAETEANYGYLMAIPTSETIKLYVVYTITYAEQISAPITKDFVFTTGCTKGTAYAANLLFQLDESNEIKFSVDVTNWSEPTPTTFYPEAAPVQQ